MKWQFDHFDNPDGNKIRFGVMNCSAPKGLIIILPGRTEFIEKYTETALNCIDKGYTVASIDWVGQGASDRLLANKNKHHSNGFESDLLDLNLLISNHLAQFEPLPKIFLAHSMGGNIALRYLHDYPNDISFAGLSAPMVDINTGVLPRAFSKWLANLLFKFSSEAYLPLGKDWSPKDREIDPNRFSYDLKRREIHNDFCSKNPVLQLGAPTIGWLKHAFASCDILKQESYLSMIKTPLFIGTAKHDAFVSNTEIKKACHILNVKFDEYDPCGHEILMEKDDIRNQFLSKFFNMIKMNLKTKS